MGNLDWETIYRDGTAIAAEELRRGNTMQPETLTALATLSPSMLTILNAQLGTSRATLDLIASDSMTSPLAIIAKYLAEGANDHGLAQEVEGLAESRVRKAFVPRDNRVDIWHPSGAVVNQLVWDMMSREKG